MRSILLVFLSVLALPVTTLRGQAIDFAHEVVPVLEQHCASCHGGMQKEGAFSINSRESTLAGGESGPAVQIGEHVSSELFLRVASDDPYSRMPPEGAPLSADEIQILASWIDAGLPWEPGYSFGVEAYEAPLRPRRPELPPPTDGRTHPIDRILDATLVARNAMLPEPVDDETFLRRASLDLVGLLPTPEQRRAFLEDRGGDKRQQLVRNLLERDVDYAEHWLTFWNDLLRNDYAGTGFITGGRQQISSWLYQALVKNLPYDQFTRELLAPKDASSEGFAAGIKWRGEVSAGQTVEIQFAQNVGQVFLGINLKCASCHDSFIDRWTLKDAYGLAAVYAERPLELHRCDKPIGETASAGWLFPELGTINADAPRPKRLDQLAELMTHPENGRFTRTIVNRLWHRLMGRGVVHPTDAMQSEPWNEDLLDYLATHLADHQYDLKATLELIATSDAYQSRAEVVESTGADGDYQYAGPRSKRMTAEQFIDATWQLTDAAPDSFDAPVTRGKAASPSSSVTELTGQWIWSRADSSQVAAGETISFRRQWTIDEMPEQAVAVISCDNEYRVWVNDQLVGSGDQWNRPDLFSLPQLKQGPNQILIEAKNGGQSPNPAGLFFEARWTSGTQGKTLAELSPDRADGPPAAASGAAQATSQSILSLGSDDQWQWTAQSPQDNGSFANAPTDWKPAVAIHDPQVWMDSVREALVSSLDRGRIEARRMVRASLLKSDFLMRSLGRPNRDQVVTVRPLEMTTLEAIDLSIGEILADYLQVGARRLAAQSNLAPADQITRLYQFALSRDPTAEELKLLTGMLVAEMPNGRPAPEQYEDILWAIVMLPEFQIVR